MIKCNKCGTLNKDSAKFCKRCGSSLAESGTKVAAPEPQVGAPSVVSKPITSQKVLSVAETGEILEKVDRVADEEGIHVLSNTFAETLSQLADNRERLAQIEEKVADALRIQREKEEKKLREISANYELTTQKIRALEELSALRRLAAGEKKLASIFRGETIDIGEELFGERREIAEEEEEEMKEEFEEDLLEEELSGELPLDELDEELEELESDEDKVECGNCHSLIPADARVCPECGAEFEE